MRILNRLASSIHPYNTSWFKALQLLPLPLIHATPDDSIDTVLHEELEEDLEASEIWEKRVERVKQGGKQQQKGSKVELNNAKFWGWDSSQKKSGPTFESWWQESSKIHVSFVIKFLWKVGSILSCAIIGNWKLDKMEVKTVDCADIDSYAGSKWRGNKNN